MAYIDVTDETFEAEVVNKSLNAPVVVDLWAPWCGPCRTLGPIIERVIDATNGKVLLAKVNVDDNPRISATFQVQSIPAVFAIKERKVIDSFIGALPEPQIAAWVARLSPAKRPAEVLIEDGIAMNSEAKLLEALALEPGNVAGVTALAEMYVDGGRNDEALALLARIPESPETAKIAARARIGTPADTSLSTIAELESLLDKVKGDDDARQRYLDLLSVLGEDPRVPDLRRKLATRLF